MTATTSMVASVAKAGRGCRRRRLGPPLPWREQSLSFITRSCPSAPTIANCCRLNRGFMVAPCARLRSRKPAIAEVSGLVVCVSLWLSCVPHSVALGEIYHLSPNIHSENETSNSSRNKIRQSQQPQTEVRAVARCLCVTLTSTLRWSLTRYPRYAGVMRVICYASVCRSWSPRTSMDRRQHPPDAAPPCCCRTNGRLVCQSCATTSIDHTHDNGDNEYSAARSHM